LAQSGRSHVPASAGAQSLVGVTNETHCAQYAGIGVVEYREQLHCLSSEVYPTGSPDGP